MVHRVAIPLVVAAACLAADGSFLSADGQGRTEILRLPPHQGQSLVTSCDAVNVWQDYVLFVTVHLQYDKDGTLVKKMQSGRMHGRSTFYSTYPDGKATGVSLTGGPEGSVFKVDYADGRMTVSGLEYKVTLPGVGMIFHQGGHLAFDPATGWVQVGGPDDAWSGDFGALCQALTP